MSAIPDELLDAIVDLASALPQESLRAVTARLRAGATASYATETLGQDSARARVGALVSRWRAAMGDGRAAELAAALEGAGSMHAWHRRRVTHELVWTGPVPERTLLRRTDQALLELIRGATSTLLLVSFATYRVEVLQRALEDAVARGVAVDLVLESSEESGARAHSEPRRALGETLTRRARLWSWPLELRERDPQGPHGVLHAKCALADRRRLFVSSANLTGHAMALNMELGVLVEGSSLPSDVAEHFEALMASGVLREQAP